MPETLNNATFVTCQDLLYSINFLKYEIRLPLQKLLYQFRIKQESLQEKR